MRAPPRTRFTSIAVTPLLVLLATHVVAFAEPIGRTRVVSQGSAAGTSPGSRDEAIRRAKSQAVTMWLETLLGATPDERFGRITGDGEKYVASARLLSLNLVDGRTEVEVEAHLDDWALRVDTATVLFQTRRDPPRVAFLVDEQVVHETARRFQHDCAVTAPIEEAFRKQGFDLIEAETVDAAYSNRDVAMLMGAPVDDLRRVGREFNADALVIVRSILNVEPAQSGRSMLNAHVEIEARVLGVHDGEIHEDVQSIAEVTCAVAEDGIRFAVDDAVYKIRSRLLVGTALATGAGESRNAYSLTVTGISSWLDIERASEFLSGYPGVADVSVVSARRDLGLIRFEYAGRMAELVGYLEQGSESFPGLQVESVFGNEQQIRMPPNLARGFLARASLDSLNVARLSRPVAQRCRRSAF